MLIMKVNCFQKYTCDLTHLLRRYCSLGTLPCFETRTCLNAHTQIAIHNHHDTGYTGCHSPGLAEAVGMDATVEDLGSIA